MNELQLEIFEQTSDYSELRLRDGEGLRTRGLDRSAIDRLIEAVDHVYNGLGEWQRALEYFGQALPIRRQVGDQAGEAQTRYNVAMIHRARGDLRRAIAELERVVELDRHVSRPELQSDTEMLHSVRQEQAGLGPGRGSR